MSIIKFLKYDSIVLLTELDGMVFYSYHFDFVLSLLFALDNHTLLHKNVYGSLLFSVDLQVFLQIEHHQPAVHDMLSRIEK